MSTLHAPPGAHYSKLSSQIAVTVAQLEVVTPWVSAWVGNACGTVEMAVTWDPRISHQPVVPRVLSISKLMLVTSCYKIKGKRIEKENDDTKGA